MFGLLGDIVRTVVAPVRAGVDVIDAVTRPVSKPVADEMEQLMKELRELLKDTQR